MSSQKLIAVPANTEQSCDGCKLADPYEPEVCLAHPCMAPYREDGRDVIWVEAETWQGGASAFV